MNATCYYSMNDKKTCSSSTPHSSAREQRFSYLTMNFFWIVSNSAASSSEVRLANIGHNSPIFSMFGSSPLIFSLSSWNALEFSNGFNVWTYLWSAHRITEHQSSLYCSSARASEIYLIVVEHVGVQKRAACFILQWIIAPALSKTQTNKYIINVYIYTFFINESTGSAVKAP